MSTNFLEIMQFPTPFHTESSLTLDNLVSILKDIQTPVSVAAWLAVSDIELDLTIATYEDVSQCSRAFWEYFLNHHPAPSWKVVAVALWRTENYEVLEKVMTMYLKRKFA